MRYFLFFLLSGLCALIYETIWLRLAMASFGVTAQSLAIVLSVFMGGLAIGSWLVSKLKPVLVRLNAQGTARLYAVCELAIAALGLFVPGGMRLGAHLLGPALAGRGASAWYAAELAWLTALLLPSCIVMGATLPLGMAALEAARGHDRGGSFSFLYLANVLGAVVGTLLSAFMLIELLGFHGTLSVASALNVVIAAAATFLAAGPPAGAAQPAAHAEQSPQPASTPGAAASPAMLVALFLTGLCSMAAEVVWTRLYTAFVGTLVYSFALLLAVYLLATFAGSAFYRARRAQARPVGAGLWVALALLSALPLVATDFRYLSGLVQLGQGGAAQSWGLALLRVVLGVGPSSFVLGYVTPQLVDRWSGGRPERAGVAYAVNTVACVLGPLVASFALLPFMSERTALALLCAPFLAFALFFRRPRLPVRLGLAAGGATALAVVALNTAGIEYLYPAGRVARDHTATTIAAGSGLNKTLIVNGVGMTALTPITKAMVHFPLALLGRPPRKVLVICFGMGTSFRSALTWGVDTTAVELVPSVPGLFSYFHRDAAEVMRDPNAHVVVDDGRRFVETSAETYDLILIDPPPPVGAASSSLLYSVEFYEQIRNRLTPDGILAQWVPGGDATTVDSVARAVLESFESVRTFRGYGFGLHIFARKIPLELSPPATLAARLPPRAQKDFVEWGPERTPEANFARLLAAEVRAAEVLARHRPVPALSDDRAVNEYYFLREWTGLGPNAHP